jgi:cytochrome c biogenesis protein CcmG, thiol:disulfide interchange protein DsbE
MDQKLKYIIFSVLSILLALYLNNSYRVAPTVDLEKLTLWDMDENPIQLKDKKGQKIILSFGASWCPNCIEELDAIAKLPQSELGGAEVIVISDEPPAKIRAFRDRKAYPFTFLKMEQKFADIGIHSIPTTYIIDTSFEVKDNKVGYINWQDASTREHIRKLME